MITALAVETLLVSVLAWMSIQASVTLAAILTVILLPWALVRVRRSLTLAATTLAMLAMLWRRRSRKWYSCNQSNEYRNYNANCDRPFRPIQNGRTMGYRLSMADTGPDKLSSLPLDTLQACYHYLSEERWNLFDRTEIAVCEVRLTELRGEIELKRIAAQSTQQHGESIAHGSTILYWTKWAVAVGVVVPILVALIAEIPFSRLLPPEHRKHRQRRRRKRQRPSHPHQRPRQ